MTIRTKYLALLCFFAPGLLGSCSEAASSETKPTAKSASAAGEGPIVVELFQSQGCSSCPPANAALNALAPRADVIALSYAVTYWDRLGWKDKFASPAFTQRQYDYKAALRADSVYTPQVILNGTRAIVGNGKGELAHAVAATKAIGGGPAITAEQGKVSIGVGTGKATVWLVRYDPRTHNVAIRSGENEGRTLPHRNIVRQFEKLGSWSGKAISFTVAPAKDQAWHSVILVQREQAGAIISAKRL
jgi:hypothetical protein